MKNPMAAMALATAVAITATAANAGSVASYQSQIAKGWAGEGVVMCTPVS